MKTALAAPVSPLAQAERQLAKLRRHAGRWVWLTARIERMRAEQRQGKLAEVDA